MKRPITRSLLATFIEYAAIGRVTLSERHRFAVQHYGDQRMEEARRECVRILRPVTRGKCPRLTWNAPYAIAAALRASEGKK